MDDNLGQRQRLSSTSIHIMALDGTLNVNSLFAFAAFIGIAFNPADPANSLVAATACAATSATGKHFIESHVYSFSAFLFSSLIASGLKLAIRAGIGEMHSGGRVHLRLLRVGILASAAGTVLGCAFLTAALVDLVQIKLGNVGCWGWHAVAAVSPLLVLVPSALLIYSPHSYTTLYWPFLPFSTHTHTHTHILFAHTFPLRFLRFSFPSSVSISALSFSARDLSFAACEGVEIEDIRIER